MSALVDHKAVMSLYCNTWLAGCIVTCCVVCVTVLSDRGLHVSLRRTDVLFYGMKSSFIHDANSFVDSVLYSLCLLLRLFHPLKSSWMYGKVDILYCRWCRILSEMCRHWLWFFFGL